MENTKQVHCVCGGFGFPVGTASSNRVMLIGRALYKAGITFHVWHIGPSSYPQNTTRRGMLYGITWEYLSPSTKRPVSRFLRILYFFYGCLLLPCRLIPLRRKIIVFLFSQGDLINIWVLLVCKVLNISVAQECNEWWPDTPSKTSFNRWMYSKIMFHMSSGALSISSKIESHIHKINAKKEYPVLRVPVLVDSDEVRLQREHKPLTVGEISPYLFWCGMVDGYQVDIIFLVKVLGVVGKEHNLWPKMVVSGPCGEAGRRAIREAVEQHGVIENQVIITGFVQETELFRLATHGAVLLLPLWDDERSKTRFPTKLGLYAAAGRPIISCPIGEIPSFLEDGTTALFAPPGDEIAWANHIARFLQDDELCARIVENLSEGVLPRLDYRYFDKSLKNWFMDL